MLEEVRKKPEGPEDRKNREGVEIKLEGRQFQIRVFSLSHAKPESESEGVWHIVDLEGGDLGSACSPFLGEARGAITHSLWLEMACGIWNPSSSFSIFKFALWSPRGMNEC